jgi:hypothetical protein
VLHNNVVNSSSLLWLTRKQTEDAMHAQSAVFIAPSAVTVMLERSHVANVAQLRA